MKEKCFGIIIADRDYKRFINLNRILLEDLSKNFKKVYVINVFGLKFRQNKGSIINKKGFPINFIHIKIDSSLQFLHFFKDKNFVALQFLAKSPDYFRIYYLIKKADIKNIMIMNLGEFGNKQTIDWKHLKTLKASAHFYDKGFYYFFRILTTKPVKKTHTQKQPHSTFKCFPILFLSFSDLQKEIIRQQQAYILYFFFFPIR